MAKWEKEWDGRLTPGKTPFHRWVQHLQAIRFKHAACPGCGLPLITEGGYGICLRCGCDCTEWLLYVGESARAASIGAYKQELARGGRNKHLRAELESAMPPSAEEAHAWMVAHNMRVRLEKHPWLLWVFVLLSLAGIAVAALLAIFIINVALPAGRS